MDTKDVTVTIKIPLELNSLHELEMTIHQEGQRIKQQLFQQELQAIIDKQKEMASEPVACPHCQKKRPFSLAANQGS